ncbi:hypothetical protein BDY21DRAFT_291811 [Lineolata rhizophorae]|uniref:arginine--tRNA ligase n=1 Tax=Lineolata rhizophorae TaxID=578093 RepID=A0A6A6NQJ7_9PEZI|nr:hypothetical protein BDY21DRAFT_291811 [Lineolata rhizophorae]
MEQLTSTLKKFGLDTVPKFDGTYPDLNIVDVYRSHLTDLLVPILPTDKADPAVVYKSLQWTQSLDKGDLVLPVAALRIKKSPKDLAQELVDKFPESPLVQKPVFAQMFLQFFFKPLPLAQLVLPAILKQGPSYGFNPSLGLKDPTDPSKGKKKMVLEFSSPNIAKPFHQGHLRSTIIGAFLSNLYEAAGWDVIRMNYLGDWGKQYGVLGVGFEKFGNEDALQENPIGHLYDIYVKISSIARDEAEKIKAKEEEVKATQHRDEDEAIEVEAELERMRAESVDEQARLYFKRMVDGDKEALGTWKRFRDLSIERYKKTYARLNIQYDEYSGESQIKDESMDKAAKLMEEKGVSEVSDGAVLVDLTKYSKKLGKALVKKKDGTSLYLTRDIGAIFERWEKYKFDKMIYVVASQQDLHLAQLFQIVSAIGEKELASRCQHINFGLVLGMSTRKGTAKFLDDILKDVGDKMHEVMKSNEAKYVQVEDPDKTADILGISAVMVQDMTGKRINNYEFDINRMTSFEGDTGPYLQYAHARLCSITRKAQLSDEEIATADFSLLSEKHAVDLIRALAQWPDVFVNTLRTLEPVTVLTYLFKMTHALSSSYDHLQVVGSEPEKKKARMALYNCARQVLNNGMRLLGLTPVDR